MRQMFQDELRAHAERYHPVDVERVQSEQWQIERFLINSNKNVPIPLDDYTEVHVANAFQSLIESLQWKKRLLIHDITEDYFPKEFYFLYQAEIHGADQDGRPILWETYKNQRKFTEFSFVFQQFIAFTFEKVDRMGGREGFTYVANLASIGIDNLDIEMMKFRIDCAIKYFPFAVKRGCFVDLPLLLKPIMKLILAFMTDHIRRLALVCDHGQLGNFIDTGIIPQNLGGTRSFRNCPTGCRPLLQVYQQLDVSEHFAKSYLNYYRDVLTGME